MTRNYENTVIYKIVCKDLNTPNSYVGNTTQFIKRKGDHKRHCNSNHHYKVYQFIKDNGGWDNFDMIEIEKFPCKDGNEARARERYWYEQLSSNLNMIKPLITEDRIEYKKQQDKNYNKLNKESIAAKKKITQQLNKISIAVKKKEYYESNKEIWAQNNKIYRETNIDKIKERERTVHLCECGCTYTQQHKSRHMKSPKHLNNLKNI